MLCTHIISHSANWCSIAMLRCVRRGAARDALTTGAEHRRVARACLAARASRGLVPARTAHDAVLA
eukprot:scaffold10295_cov75-Phaeocystis_antarctica.AAC.3